MITLTLTGPIVPKARPRCGRGRAYLPARYRDWKDDAIAQLSQQYSGEPVARVSISIELHGSLRGDIDNLAGSILDAMVQSGVLVDDHISCVPSLSMRHHKGREKRAVVVLEVE